MRISEFRVPLARDANGTLTRPEEANGRAFNCPECEQTVAPRGGNEKGPRRHFFHLSRRVVCALETDEHVFAKYVLARVVLDWLAGAGPRPEIVRMACAACGAAGPVQRLPRDIDAVAVEKRDRVSGRRPDVLLSSSGKTRVAVEVVATHFVDETKAASLGTLQWCELLAKEILKEPACWRLVSDRLKQWACGRCMRLRSRLESAQKNRDRRHSSESDVARTSKTSRIVDAEWALEDAYLCPGLHTYKGPRAGCVDCERELKEIAGDLAIINAPPAWADPTFIFTARRKSSLLRLADRRQGAGKVRRLMRRFRPNKRNVVKP